MEFYKDSNTETGMEVNEENLPNISETERTSDTGSSAYSYTPSHDNDNDFEVKRKGYSDAGCLIMAFLFVLVTVFIIAILLIVFVPNKNSGEPGISDTADPYATALPSSAIASGNAATPMPLPTPTSRPMTNYDGQLPTITNTSNPFPEIISGVQSGVVSVYNYSNTTNIFGKNSVEVQSSGSGFVISSEGYVITNAHVISNAVKVTLVLFDDKEVDCEVIGTDVSTDIAILRFDNSSLGIKPLYLGDSDNTKVGEFVITVGDPSGRELAGTITFGIVSAVNRTVNIDGRTNAYIQTDAAMNPGNSGGPLINMKGEVIGVTSAKTVTASYDEYGNAISAEGLGFAIPTNTVKSIAESLITHGRIVRPGVGLTIYPSTDEELYNAKLEYGLTVQSIIKGGPADKAGIKANDILIACDGKSLRENTDLTDIVQSHRVGDSLKITLYRDGNNLTTTITIGDLNGIE